MRSLEHDAIVIGAGAAGLTAALGLREAGLEVVVVEARERTGGRMATEAAPGGGAPIELGAEFIHGEPSELLELVRAAGLRLIEIDGDVWQFHDGTLRPL